MIGYWNLNECRVGATSFFVVYSKLPPEVERLLSSLLKRDGHLKGLFQAAFFQGRTVSCWGKYDGLLKCLSLMVDQSSHEQNQWFFWTNNPDMFFFTFKWIFPKLMFFWSLINIQTLLDPSNKWNRWESPMPITHQPQGMIWDMSQNLGPNKNP